MFMVALTYNFGDHLLGNMWAVSLLISRKLLNRNKVVSHL